jgi:hypothetical protein
MYVRYLPSCSRTAANHIGICSDASLPQLTSHPSRPAHFLSYLSTSFQSSLANTGLIVTFWNQPFQRYPVFSQVTSYYTCAGGQMSTGIKSAEDDHVKLVCANQSDKYQRLRKKMKFLIAYIIVTQALKEFTHCYLSPSWTCTQILRS